MYQLSKTIILDNDMTYKKVITINEMPNNPLNSITKLKRYQELSPTDKTNNCLYYIFK